VGSLRRGPSPCLRRHRRRSASRALRRRPSLCLNRHVRRSRSLRRRPSPHLRRHRLGPRRGLCAAALLSALTGTAVGPGPTPPPISPPQTAPPRSTSRPLRHRPCLCLNRHRRRSRSLRGRPSPCRSGHRRSRRLSLPQGHRLGSTRPARCLVVAASRGTAVPPEPLPLLQGHRQGTGPPPSSPPYAGRPFPRQPPCLCRRAPPRVRPDRSPPCRTSAPRFRADLSCPGAPRRSTRPRTTVLPGSCRPAANGTRLGGRRLSSGAGGVTLVRLGRSSRSRAARSALWIRRSPAPRQAQDARVWPVLKSASCPFYAHERRKSTASMLEICG
jgi:hypothetical protein